MNHHAASVSVGIKASPSRPSSSEECRRRPNRFRGSRTGPPDRHHAYRRPEGNRSGPLNSFHTGMVRNDLRNAGLGLRQSDGWAQRQTPPGPDAQVDLAHCHHAGRGHRPSTRPASAVPACSRRIHHRPPEPVSGASSGSRGFRATCSRRRRLTTPQRPPTKDAAATTGT